MAGRVEWRADKRRFICGFKIPTGWAWCIPHPKGRFQGETQHISQCKMSLPVRLKLFIVPWKGQKYIHADITLNCVGSTVFAGSLAGHNRPLASSTSPNQHLYLLKGEPASLVVGKCVAGTRWRWFAYSSTSYQLSWCVIAFSIYSTSTMGGFGGFEKIKDTRPLHDKSYVQQCIRQLHEVKLKKRQR